jgi:phosphoenolpyruvate phosphomutase
MIIWANHLLRSSVQTMQKTAVEIYREQSLVGVEERIVPVKEIFRLQNMDELKEAEGLYLPKKRRAADFQEVAPTGI